MSARGRPPRHLNGKAFLPAPVLNAHAGKASRYDQGLIAVITPPTE